MFISLEHCDKKLEVGTHSLQDVNPRGTNNSTKQVNKTSTYDAKAHDSASEIDEIILTKSSSLAESYMQVQNSTNVMN